MLGSDTHKLALSLPLPLSEKGLRQSLALGPPQDSAAPSGTTIAPIRDTQLPPAQGPVFWKFLGHRNGARTSCPRVSLLVLEPSESRAGVGTPESLCVQDVVLGVRPRPARWAMLCAELLQPRGWFFNQRVICISFQYCSVVPWQTGTSLICSWGSVCPLTRPVRCSGIVWPCLTWPHTIGHHVTVFDRDLG